MFNTTNLTRRAALLGAAVSTVALAAPVATVAATKATDKPPLHAELHAICAEYEHSAIEANRCDRAARAMEREFGRRLEDANLMVRLTGRGGLPNYLTLNRDIWPDTADEDQRALR